MIIKELLELKFTEIEYSHDLREKKRFHSYTSFFFNPFIIVVFGFLVFSTEFHLIFAITKISVIGLIFSAILKVSPLLEKISTIAFIIEDN